jgi:excinuclease ABC subunit A
MSETKCPDCKGARLKKESLCVTVGGINIDAFVNKSIAEAMRFVQSLKLGKRDAMIAQPILKEIGERLNFLASVGLEYLTLARAFGHAVGGESQAFGWLLKSVRPDGCFIYTGRAEYRIASAG